MSRRTSRTSKTTTTDRPHPIVAKLWHKLAGAAEDKGMGELRRETLAGLSGRVVEVGAGDGLNFRHYPPEVREVIAVEPEPSLRAWAEEAASKAPVPVRVLPGVADRLPVGDGEADAVVASLVLCTVPDLPVALAEVRRVLAPGGHLRFFEHVRARHPRMARAQDVYDVVYSRVNGWHCHANRDTPAALEAAGFRIERLRRFRFTASRLDYMVSPHVIGEARPA